MGGRGDGKYELRSCGGTFGCRSAHNMIPVGDNLCTILQQTLRIAHVVADVIHQLNSCFDIGMEMVLYAYICAGSVHACSEYCNRNYNI
jgi:hypothetical protein